MKGLGVRYLCSLSSKKRSGSNSSANKYRYQYNKADERKIAVNTIRAPKIFSTMHEEYAVNTSVRLR